MRALWISCAVGCSIGCDATSALDPHRPIEGVDEVSQPLMDLTAQCGFTSGTGVLTLVLDGGDIAVITRAANANITINGYVCGAATATNVKRIDVTEGSPGNETLILDYGGRLFATGTKGAVGVTVDLGGQTDTDAVKVIGTTGVDNFVVGAGGISLNNDAFVDITLTHVEELAFSLDDGDDTFSGTGNATTGAAYATAIVVYGGNGNDTLRGGDGDDTLYGGAGNDLFLTGAVADGNDELHGGADSDTADYSPRLAALTITIDDLADDGEPGETDNVGTDIEILKGGMGDDHLTGSANPETIYGGPGNDTIAGGGGNDLLYGDAGNDVFDEGSGVNGADVFNGGPGIDLVSYAGRGNTVLVSLDGVANDGEVGEGDKVMLDVEDVTGGSGNDTITGSALGNTLDGGAGNDTISGGGGNDVLRGGLGNDILNGEAGDDTFDEGADGGADTLTGGTGIDTVDYAARSVALIVVMDGTTGSGEPSEGDHIATDVENLIGGSGADSLTGNAADNQIEGGPGTAVDSLDGGAGDDVLDGGGGNDLIDCGGGDADINLDLSIGSTSRCEL
ncbi:MAG: calcium-binding protein [Kofleriaceae bacterium]